MKALSIRQPWAWAIINAGKRIENRSWNCRYRGPILLHASQGMTADEYMDFYQFYDGEFGEEPTFLLLPAFGNLQRGGIVGRAVIVDCVTESNDPWFFGPYGIVLDEVEPLPFRPLKGMLGLFEVPE